MIEIVFFLLVMIAVWFTFVNLGRALHGQNVPTINFFLQSSAIAGIITLYYFGYILYIMLYTYLIGIIPALFFYIYVDNKVHKDDKDFTDSKIIVFCAVIWPFMLILQLFFILVDITEKLRK